MILLRHGERYAYAFYLLLQLTGLWDPDGSAVPREIDAWLYDVACQVLCPYLPFLDQSVARSRVFNDAHAAHADDGMAKLAEDRP